MSSPEAVWQAASGRPFKPLVGKDRQFVVGFTLLLIGMSSNDQTYLFRANHQEHFMMAK